MTGIFEISKILPHPPEVIFKRVIDLEQAPRWHGWFTHIEKITEGEIAVSTSWRLDYQMTGIRGSMTIQIEGWELDQVVHFRGSRTLNIVPRFVVSLEPTEAGTRIHYSIDPNIPGLPKPIMRLMIPYFGRRDLGIYFRELETQLAGLG